MTEELMRSTVALRIGLLVVCVAVSAGCAAASKAPARSGQSAPAASEPANEPARSSTGASEAEQSRYALPPPPPEATPAQPGGGGAAGGSRSMALQSAAREIEVSQRELDVAAGDCRNACRALGSMDRAAGKVCELSADDERHRCDDAKRHVYVARDRVKATCGACPGGPSVDRAAPIPSLR